MNKGLLYFGSQLIKNGHFYSHKLTKNPKVSDNFTHIQFIVLW